MDLCSWKFGNLQLINGVQPPAFVGNSYHCELGYSGQRDPGVVFLTGDPCGMG